jgi:hypothetical protein
MHERRVFAQPRLKRGPLRTPVYLAIAAEPQACTFSPGLEGARDFRDAETRLAGRAGRPRRHGLAGAARRPCVWRRC